MLLNTTNAVLQVVTVYLGSVNAGQLRVGEVFKEARHNSATEDAAAWPFSARHVAD